MCFRYRWTTLMMTGSIMIFQKFAMRLTIIVFHLFQPIMVCTHYLKKSEVFKTRRFSVHLIFERNQYHLQNWCHTYGIHFLNEKSEILLPIFLSDNRLVCPSFFIFKYQKWKGLTTASFLMWLCDLSESSWNFRMCIIFFSSLPIERNRVPKVPVMDRGTTWGSVLYTAL